MNTSADFTGWTARRTRSVWHITPPSGSTVHVTVTPGERMSEADALERAARIIDALSPPRLTARPPAALVRGSPCSRPPEAPQARHGPIG
jgi:hypothetical protein